MASRRIPGSPGRARTRPASPARDARPPIDPEQPPPTGVEGAIQRAFRLPPLAAVGALVALAAVSLLSATQGAAGLAFGDVLAALVDRLPLVDLDSPLSSRQEGILFQIRLPRLVLGMLVGGSLAMAGAAYQGVFRNPLADPYLLGVSAGAGFGAVLALGFGLDLGRGPFDAVAAAAFLGALVAVAASATIARGAWHSPATLLLAGVAMAALFSAAQTYAPRPVERDTYPRSALVAVRPAQHQRVEGGRDPRALRGGLWSRPAAAPPAPRRAAGG